MDAITTFVQACMAIGNCVMYLGEVIGGRIYGDIPVATGLNQQQVERLHQFHKRHGPLRMAVVTLICIGGTVTCFVVGFVFGWVHAALVAIIPFLGIVLWSVIEFRTSRRRLIRGLRRRGRLPLCPQCGYDVSKTPVSHCSECGAAVFPL